MCAGMLSGSQSTLTQRIKPSVEAGAVWQTRTVRRLPPAITHQLSQRPAHQPASSLTAARLQQRGLLQRRGSAQTTGGPFRMGEEVAIVGGGCFWCTEACYNQTKGVFSAVSGYAGGHVENPTYEQVCGKQTGHAEVVKVTYDPSIIDYRTILEIFFTIHDPTTKDRQGNDVGPQYRSVVMYLTEDQRRIAEEVMQDISEQKLYSDPLVTELLPASTFYQAEKHHQRYYAKNPNQGYCSFVVGPKVAKFRAKWSKMLSA